MTRGPKRRRARTKGHGNAAWAAFPRQYRRARARALGQGLPPSPLSLGAYKYPPGVFSWEISKTIASRCNLIFRIVVVLVSLFF